MTQAAEYLTRPSVPQMDEILGRAWNVLDHGFVRVIDYMGDEPAICQAARVSYGKGTKTVNEDRGLIRYLMRHRHTTPLEMCEIKLHVKLPIFVARQWIRHRTASVNEVSARYSILAREFYVPDLADMQPQTKSNKQGRAGTLPEQPARNMQETLRQQGEIGFNVYEELLHGWPWIAEDGGVYEELLHGWPWIAEDGGVYEIPGIAGGETMGDFAPEEFHARRHESEQGLARELARMALPLSTYTEWYWKVDLHNLLHFLSLRADPHAQKEIRVYADVILNLVKRWLPNVWEAFNDYVLGAVSFSRPEMENLMLLIGDARTQFVHPDMSRGEHDEFLKKLDGHRVDG